GFSSLQGRMSIALRPPFTTTIADGTNPGNTTIAPGAAATDVDAFTLQTSSGTDTVTAATVTLAAGTWAGINLVQITDNSKVVMRNTATITDVPAEGTAPAMNATVGTSVVRYISNGTSFIDTSLAGGTYFYRIFAKDTSGNYSATGVEVSATVSVLAPTTGEL